MAALPWIWRALAPLLAAVLLFLWLRVPASSPHGSFKQLEQEVTVLELEPQRGRSPDRRKQQQQQQPAAHS